MRKQEIRPYDNSSSLEVHPKLRLKTRFSEGKISSSTESIHSVPTMCSLLCLIILLWKPSDTNTSMSRSGSRLLSVKMRWKSYFWVPCAHLRCEFWAEKIDTYEIHHCRSTIIPTSVGTRLNREILVYFPFVFLSTKSLSNTGLFAFSLWKSVTFFRQFLFTPLCNAKKWLFRV